MPQINNRNQATNLQPAKPFLINTKQQDKLFSGLDSNAPVAPRQLNAFEKLAVGTYDAVSSITKFFGGK